MSKKLGLILLVLSTASSICAYASEPNYVPVIGTGQFSCGKFIEYRDQGNSSQIELVVQWTWGFLTAYNFKSNFGPSIKKSQFVVHPPDSPSVALYLETYCRKHPVNNVMDGVFNLINDTGGQVVWNKK